MPPAYWEEFAGLEHLTGCQFDDGHDYRLASEWLGLTALRVYAHWVLDTHENDMTVPPVPATNVVPLRRSVTDR